jgi:hypothetical protein
MNRAEHILTILGEEGVEVAQRCSKALRFGLKERQPRHQSNNAMQIYEEYLDMIAVMEMAIEEGLMPEPFEPFAEQWKKEKKAKVEKFLEYSRQIGTLND